MKQASLLLFSFFIIFTASSVQAKQTVSVDYMHGFDDIDGMRFAYRPLEQTLTTDWFGDLKLYWEVSAVVWEYGENDTHSTSYGASLTPVFMKQVSTLYDKYPVYIEAGIGASYIGNQKVAGKDIGSNYQFRRQIRCFCRDR